MSRRLRPHTIVPAELYVERAADRQLEQVVTDMGRPGYVLVARQMGKTNLLLNMKRKRQANGDVVPYFDLSNKFASIRPLFRHIVDSLLEATSSLQIENIQDKLDEDRLGDKLEPNIEYDRHLRYILRAVPEHRVIIILDEVDSLVGSSYSDTFFAQIRSMYFARINHNEYERLTYVLSGVAEPSDLIKDKNISPFNIGEKIYLDDFTKPETINLLDKSGLKLSPAVIDEVYSWASGNPRMTWDIFSELEASLEIGADLTSAVVEKAVHKLYLTRFDRAPIDHIRTLAASDPQIRSSIATIRWRQAETLDDAAVSRLYLAGVSNAAAGAAVRIKNRIIDAALSDVWMARVASAEKSLLDVANDHFKHSRYSQVVELTEEYMREPNAAELTFIPLYNLGVSKFYTDSYAQAIQDLLRAHKLTDSADLRASCLYIIGTAFLKLGEINQAIENLESASRNANMWAMRAKVALQSAYYLRDDANLLELIEGLHSEIFDAADTKNPDPDVRITAQESTAVSFFNLARAYQAAKTRDKAEQALKNALQSALPNMVPYLQLYMTRFSQTEENTTAIIAQAARAVISNRVKLADSEQSVLHFNEITLALILVKLLETKQQELFQNLLTYSVETVYSHTRRPFDLVLHLTRSNISENPTLAVLLWEAVDNLLDENVLPDYRLEAYRLLTQYTSQSRKSAARKLYLSEIKHRQSVKLELIVDDFLVLLTMADEYETLGLHNDAYAVNVLGLSSKGIERSDTWVIRVVFLRNAILLQRELKQAGQAKLRASWVKFRHCGPTGAPNSTTDTFCSATSDQSKVW
jgi:tetratricopeptide (TPR) repeat protein